MQVIVSAFALAMLCSLHINAQQACVSPASGFQCAGKAAALGDSVWRIWDRLLALEAESIKLGAVHLISAENIPFTISAPGRYVLCDDLVLSSSQDTNSIITVSVPNNGGPVILDLNDHYIQLLQNTTSANSAIVVASVNQLVIKNGIIDIVPINGGTNATGIFVGNSRGVYVRDVVLGSSILSFNSPNNTFGIIYSGTFDSGVLNTRAYGFDASFSVNVGGGNYLFYQCDSAFAINSDFFFDGSVSSPNDITLIECVAQSTRDGGNNSDSFSFVGGSTPINNIACVDCVAQSPADAGFVFNNVGASTIRRCNVIGSVNDAFRIENTINFPGMYMFDCFGGGAGFGGGLAGGSAFNIFVSPTPSNGFTLRSCIGFDSSVISNDFQLGNSSGGGEGFFNCCSNRSNGFSGNISHVISSNNMVNAGYFHNMQQ